MNEQDSEQKLDELISRTINSTRPEFDPEEWKQQYPEELEILRSRAARGASTGRFTMPRVIGGKPIAKLAAAAAIGIAAVFIVGRTHRGPEPTEVRPQTASSVEMATAISLERAYRRGGIEAVEDQCRKVFGTTAGESTSPSILQLLGEQGTGVKIFGGKNL